MAKTSVDIITTIINKFNTVESSGLKNMSRDVFVLVDESHRSNYNGYMASGNLYFREMENISYHVAAGHIDEKLLRKLMIAILNEKPNPPAMLGRME